MSFFNMIKRIKNINTFRSNIYQKADDIINRYMTYLSNGSWSCDCTLSLFYNKKYTKFVMRHKANLSAFFRFCKDLNKFAYTIKNKILNYRCLVTANNTVFNASYFMISTSGSEVRFVDLENGLLLTKYDNLEKMEKMINNRKLFSEKGFNTIPIIDVDYNNIFTIEKFINQIKYNHNVGFQNLIIQYNNYFLHNDCKSNPLDENSIEHKCNIFNYCHASSVIKKNYINFLKSKNYKTILSHGDCYFLNYLFDGEQYYLIDFEHPGEKIFFYDIIYYIVDDFYLNNHHLAYNYLNGKMDLMFEKLFNLAGATYQKEMRFIYFLVVFNDFMGRNPPDDLKKSLEKLIIKYGQ